MQKAAWPLEGSDVMWGVDNFVVVASTNNQTSKIRCVTFLTLNIEVSFFGGCDSLGHFLPNSEFFMSAHVLFHWEKGPFLESCRGWVGLWGFLWWAPSAKRKDHHGVSSGWSCVWHRSNTGLSSTQYEQIPIILGVWPFWLTPFFFRSITFWRAYG